MLNKDKIKREINDFKLSYCINQMAVDRLDALLLHLSAQYEKLIEEVIGEEFPYIEEQLKTERDEEVREYLIGKRNALSLIRTSLQERGIKIK